MLCWSDKVPSLDREFAMEAGGEGARDAGTDGRRASPSGAKGMPSKFPFREFAGPRSGELSCEPFGE